MRPRPRAGSAPRREPHSHTRPRSLRTRSTIITFSARSLARKPSGVAAVPLIGRDSTTSPSRRRNRSGEAEATCDAVARAAARRRSTAPGCPRRGRRRGRRRRRRRGSGADSTRHRFTWYTSPAAIDVPDRPRRRRSSRRGRASVRHASIGGPVPRPSRPRRRRPNGARTGRTPADRRRGARPPRTRSPSSAARSAVTSTQVGAEAPADHGERRRPASLARYASRRTIAGRWGWS